MKRRLLLGPVGLLVTGTPVLGQAIGQGQGVDVSAWRVVLSLLLCLGLGVAAIYVLRRRYGAGGGILRASGERRIRLVDQQTLGQQRSICLVEIDGRRFVALFAPQAASLHPLDSGGEPGAPAIEIAPEQ